ncbi:MAG: TlpA disulfide reductase family protein [Polaromonas sp.]
MNRRNMLYGGAAVAAALSGAGAAWWKFRPHETVLPAPVSVPAKEVDAFWAMSFDTPDGKPLPMSSFRGKLLLVNFWATWCPPCIEELPLLDFFYQENKDKNIQLLGLAVDQPSAVRTWLETRPLNFPVGMVGFEGTELSKSLGNLSGSLPFTVVFSPAGKLIHHKIGKVLPEELVKWTQLG